MGWNRDTTIDMVGHPAAFGTPVGYVLNPQPSGRTTSEHIVYQGFKDGDGGDGTLHELWRNTSPTTEGSWGYTPLTESAGAPAAHPQSPLGAYAFDEEGTQHVVYVGTDLNVHELWWDPSGWHHNPLTETGGVPVKAGTVGYAFFAEQQVLYLGTDNHVHLLHWKQGWQDQDLTPNGGPAAPGAVPAAYASAADQAIHLIYLAGQSTTGEGPVYELSRDSAGNWTPSAYPLTAAAEAPPAAIGGRLSGYSFDARASRHVIYPGVDGHLRELRWQDGAWQPYVPATNDLIAQANSPAMRAGDSPSAFVFAPQRSERVVYVAGSGNVYELRRLNATAWTALNLNGATAAPPASSSANSYVTFFGFPRITDLTSIGTPAEHVVYTSDSNQITLLSWTPLVAAPVFVSSRLRGNGLSAVVGFADDGVHTAVSTGDGLLAAPNLVLSNFGRTAGGWQLSAHPRLLADVTGSGAQAIVGFGDAGIYTALPTASGTFTDANFVLGAFGHQPAGGSWDYQDVRMLADITGDHRADVVGFKTDGAYTALSQGDGTFRLSNPQGSPAGRVLEFERSTFEDSGRLMLTLADVTGTGGADIVGFDADSVHLAPSLGNGHFGPLVPVLDAFTKNAGGWQYDLHPRLFADITGNGRADLVGFGDDGVWTALSTGANGFAAPAFVLANLGYTAGGWRSDMHPRVLADLTGNGRADIVGFGYDGVWTALSNGDGTFAEAHYVLPFFGYSDASGSWRVRAHTRVLADLTGNGRADIVGFGDAGVFTALSNGDGTFGPATLAGDDWGAPSAATLV
jgi:hypothetical protein